MVAKPLAKITQEATKDFIRKNVACKFGIPHTIILDNDKQFDNEKMKEFSEQFNTRCKYAMHGHLQANR